MPLSGPDNTKLEVSASPTRQTLCLSAVLFCVFLNYLFALQALVHDIYSELVEDACLGLCFEVHRAVKQGYFFLDETDQESMKEFGGCHELSTLLSSNFSLVCSLPVFNLLLFQKLWTSQEWTYLAKCTISGKTKSASVRTAKD